MPPFKANPLPIDPDAYVPEAVRRAAAKADAAMASANPTAAPATPSPTPAETIVITAPPEPPGLPNRVPLTIEAAPPPPPPAPTPAPTPAPQPEPQRLEGDAAKYKNQYEAMFGRYRDASSQLMQANARIEALENMLANMPTSAAPASTIQPTTFLTKKDEEEMGPEMIDFVKRAARELAAPLEQELQQLKQQLGTTKSTVEVDARKRMHADLSRELPNWNEINHSPDFHAWLALRAPFSSATRHKVLTEAYAQNDTARVLEIFQGFVSETATQRPASLDPVPTPVPSPGQPARPTLEDLAAPGRARTAATPQAPAEKQVIRTSDVNAFYAAVRRGAYKGREELQKQHEAELFAAMQEGRVVQDT